MHITGNLTIDAPASNVTVSNVEVDGHININTDTPSSNGVGIVPSNIVLDHVDAHGLSTEGFNGLTVTNSRIHDVSGTLSQISSYNDGSKSWPAKNLVIKNTEFYGIHSPGSGAHLEALHLMGVQGATLTGDVFDARVSDETTWTQVTAALTMEAKFQGVYNSDITLSGNTFYGGGYYQVYLLMTGNCSVTNNEFVGYTSPDGQHKGAIQYPVNGYTPGSNEPSSGYPYFQQSGNTSNGIGISLPGGR
jgi:parallel beta-helix repeat protein